MLHQVLSNLKFLVQVFIDKKRVKVNDIYVYIYIQKGNIKSMITIVSKRNRFNLHGGKFFNYVCLKIITP